ncbi:acyl-homoserine-lactone synthase [Xanthobacter sp. DSM 24535]|uniref:acyl-homoserine-lactone synthase n=1 Tax=Roseixanthobacter psychrophilus TaxID=3119917 RepID=UPI0037284709
MQPTGLTANIFYSGSYRILADDIFRLRKSIFVNELGWILTCVEGREMDQFDRNDTIHCGLFLDGDLIGTFRAIRCDRPYLSASVFPRLASHKSYPDCDGCWEISRFGLLKQHRRHAAALYAVMFGFGWARRARALVALADATYERFLQASGIVTVRYGEMQVIGVDNHGRDIPAVAGEIPMDAQAPALVARMRALLQTVEVSDETLVLGPRRISA